MKVSKNLLTGSILVGAATLAIIGLNQPNNVSAMGNKPEADSGSSAMMAKTYQATFYVAGMGGHFAKAVATIDPNADIPIQLSSLTKVDIGDGASHPTHDPRIDLTDTNTMFWSTYKVDPATGAPHVGKTDLRTGKIITDVNAPLPSQATKTKSLYCASGQTKDYFMPISMANLGYIDVFRKSDMKREHTVFLEGTDADSGKPYKFYHGATSNDMKKFLITVNEADAPHGNTIGKLHLIEVDADAMTQGKVKVLQKGMAVGREKESISFRADYSDDDTMIAASYADRMILLDDKLNTLDAEMMPKHEQNHDAIFTPDGRYLVLTLRTKVVDPECKNPDAPGPDEFLMDGQLRLYDVQARKLIGKATSTCLACHNQEGLESHAVLCGVDAVFN
ncbi:MAG: hypothetical protein KJ950_08910 [Proteobacteria bacterium]|nr:hypothetical protein [Pseudomonadota bacterium]MBU1686613.1 hypothetical protein [Pseudomonadota bacterium]